MNKWCDDWALGFDQRRRDAEQARAVERMREKAENAALPAAERERAAKSLALAEGKKLPRRVKRGDA